MASNWISVKDRLPEIHEWEPGSIAGKSDPVLVYCANFENDTPVALYPYEVAELWKGGNGDRTTLKWGCEHFGEPTHWRELPKPPNTV